MCFFKRVASISATSFYFPSVVSKELILESWEWVLRCSEVRTMDSYAAEVGCLLCTFFLSCWNPSEVNWPQQQCLLRDCEHDLQWSEKAAPWLFSQSETKHKVTGIEYPSWGKSRVSVPQLDSMILTLNCIYHPGGGCWRAFARLCHSHRQMHTKYVPRPSTVPSASSDSHTHKNENYTHRKLSMYCRNVEEK